MGPRGSSSLRLLALLVPLAGGAVAAQDAAGDPRRGEALFTGSTRLENGGAPCLACHGVAGHGLAQAASFGPDLTGSWASYGPETLDEVLADVPFPSMAPIYAAHRISPPERADLAAFLHEAAAGAPPRLGARYVAGVAAIAAALLVAFVLVGRRRASPRRETP